MSGAFWYLIRTSARNRLRRQVARLRQPRYALAFVLGLGYFWFFFIRPGRQSGFSEAGADAMVAVFGVIILGYLAWSWMFGVDRSALAFSRAEVALLFPAPVTRRQLILYKIARTQAGILVSVLVWSVILNRGGDAVTSLMRGVGLWVAITTFSLHRLGIGLHRAGLAEHGRAAARRSVPAMLVFAAACGVVAWGFRAHWDLVARAADPRAVMDAIVALAQLPPASYVLHPIEVAFAPIVLRAPGPWALALFQAVLLLLLHVWWVLGSDAAFEEAAAESSERQAKWLDQVRSRRGGGAVVRPAAVRRTIPLAAHGAPAVAIVWKNALWLLRTHQLRGILLPPLLLLAATLAFGGRDPKLGIVFAVMCGIFAAIFLLFGPATMRNDLRADLLHLPMLKTLPIRGADVVTAQVLSGALTMTVPQVMLGGVALFALGYAPGASPLPAQALVAGILGAPLALLALNVANYALHNGVALLFPGWMKLGERGPSGIEATGQMMLATGATILGLALLLLMPALAAGIGFVAFRAELGTGILVALLAGAAVLGGEAWFLMRGLGRAFERVEPTQVAA